MAHGGDASAATNGFWSALTIATTQRLPVLFFIEDNGYGISVKSDFQTPGGNIAANLSGFKNLRIIEGDSAKPVEAANQIAEAVAAVRAGEGPVLVRMLVPRLSGHSGQDTQTYKTPEEISAERARDPLIQLRAQLVPSVISEDAWKALERRAHDDVQAALAAVEASSVPDATRTASHVFSENKDRRQRRSAEAGRSVECGREAPRRQRDAAFRRDRASTWSRRFVARWNMN